MCYEKVQCRYQNDSIHPGGEYLLNSLVSAYILPTGGWNDIEALFPMEDSENPFFYWEIRSAYYETHFYITEWLYQMDAYTTISANLTLANGVPFFIEWEYIHLGDDLRLELTLI
jgi:hypothetical protein